MNGPPKFAKRFVGSGVPTGRGIPLPPKPPNIINTGSNIVTAGTGVNAYVTALKAFLHTSSSYTGWEAWIKEPGEDATFLYGEDISIVGTSASAIVPYSQITVTFRSTAGGIGKCVIMEGTQAVNQRIPARITAAAPVGALVTFLLGDTNPRRTRDNGIYTSGIFYTTKTNDALRKKFQLDA